MSAGFDPNEELLLQPGDIFIVEMPGEQGTQLRQWLEAEGHFVHSFDRPKTLLRTLNTREPHVICLGAEHLMDALSDELAQRSEQGPRMPVLVLGETQVSSEHAAQVFDCLPYPLERQRLLNAVRNAVRQARLARSLARLEHDVRRGGPIGNLVGTSSGMMALYGQVRRVLNTDVPVFLGGESGTGKELVAKAIHQGGWRNKGPFVELNCAAIPESLQESELFGHERGAFTGAIATSKGKFEQADGGTLFLDEIGDISTSVQARLLRVLQDGCLQRVGGSKTIRVNVRIVSATHRNVEALVREGKFRADLYYRIVVYPIRIPPLRERKEDIPQLVLHFLRKHAKEAGGKIKALTPEALDLLCTYNWPGNVRELENVVRRALIASDDVIDVAVLPRTFVQAASAPPPPKKSSIPPPPERSDTIVPLAELERAAIIHALEVTEGNLTVAAQKLGIGRATLYRKVASLRQQGAIPLPVLVEKDSA